MTTYSDIPSVARIPVPPSQGGTGFTFYAIGDTLYADSTTTLAKLPIGTNGYILTVSGGAPIWAPASAVIPGGTDRQIQFNNSGAFGGAVIEYVDLGGIAQLSTPDDSPPSAFRFFAGSALPAGVSDGGNMELFAGSGFTSDGEYSDGSTLTLHPGLGSGNGGSINLKGGDGSTAGSGGGLTLTSGISSDGSQGAQFVLSGGYYGGGPGEATFTFSSGGALFINGGHTIFDGTKGIADSFAVLSILPGSRQLFATDGITPTMDWGTGTLSRPSDGAVTVDFQGHSLNHSSSQSLDWANRFLTDGSSVVAADWGSRLLFATDGTTITIDWNNRLLRDAAGSQVLDWGQGICYDASTQASVDWYQRYLKGTDGGVTIDWGNRVAYDELGTGRLNWSSTGVAIGFPGPAVSTLDASGSIGFPAAVAPGTGTYNPGNQFCILPDTAGGNVTVQLPEASTCLGRIYYIKKQLAANTITVSVTGSDVIDGATTYVMLLQYKYVMVYATGGKWNIMGNN